VTAGGADEVGGDEQPWPDDGACVDRIAQVDGGPVRVGAAEIAQSGESAIEVSFARRNAVSALVAEESIDWV
jgi:hypothetical protein